VTVSRIFAFTTILLLSWMNSLAAQTNNQPGGGVMNSGMPSETGRPHGGGVMNSGTETRSESTIYNEEDDKKAAEEDAEHAPDTDTLDNGRSDMNAHATPSRDSMDEDQNPPDNSTHNNTDQPDESHGVMHSN
jgi:hypothetical protein